MGCLATHAAWNHPQTAHLTLDAGITWLHRVAGLNPATSHVIREWDRRGASDLGLRCRPARRACCREPKRARAAHAERTSPVSRSARRGSVCSRTS